MWLALALTSAMAQTCTEIDGGDILAVPPPAVIVLGERPGVKKDGRRAGRVVRQLGVVAPVTVAVEQVDMSRQPTLDRYAAGEIDTEALDVELEWEDMTRLPYAAAEPVVTSSLNGADVVAIGSETWARPADAEVPVSPAYLDILRDTMGAGDMPRAREGRFLQYVAWRDNTLAKRAIEAWDGRGYLVIVTHRNRVEGGLGVAWQAEGLTDATVDSFVLAWGGEPPCYDGDQVWKETLWEKIF